MTTTPNGIRTESLRPYRCTPRYVTSRHYLGPKAPSIGSVVEGDKRMAADAAKIRGLR